MLSSFQRLHPIRSNSSGKKSAMANVLVFFSDLQTGRSSSTVEVPLLRFWEAKNVRRGGEFMGVDMLLLDSQVNFSAFDDSCVIFDVHTFSNAYLLPQLYNQF